MNSLRDTTMLYRFLLFLALAAATLVFGGCPTPAETVKTEKPAATPPPPPEKKPVGPDITVNVASINFATVQHRIEKADIDALCRTILGAKVDLLAIQGMTRYPGVATRIDVFAAIAEGTGMRSVFGETNTVSGRQGGNALYSTYPINSHEVKPYAGIASTNFESALVGLVDVGARELAVVSTLLPEKASSADENTCLAALALLHETYGATPLIIAGNLPDPPKGSAVYHDITGPKFESHVWYTADGLGPIMTTSEITPLGVLQVIHFGVYRQGRQ